MGALENCVEELTDDQKMALLSSLKIEVQQMSQTPQAPAEYSFRSDYEDIDSVVKETARHLNLSEEQAIGFSQAITSVAESAFASVGEDLQAVSQQYVEDSRQVFGDKLNEVVTNADYVCDKIIPNLCNMEGEAFRDLLGSHGLASHPLLNHVTALYGQGRGPTMGHSIPSSTYGSRGEVSPESFRTPEAYKILADKIHPQHEELKRQIIDHMRILTFVLPVVCLSLMLGGCHRLFGSHSKSDRLSYSEKIVGDCGCTRARRISRTDAYM